MLADANFGIFKDRDEEIVDYVIELKEKSGYPEMFAAAWTKNSNESVVNLAEKLYNSNLLRSLTFSVQSMDEAVLDAIKRNNMKVNDAVLGHNFVLLLTSGGLIYSYGSDNKSG